MTDRNEMGRFTSTKDSAESTDNFAQYVVKFVMSRKPVLAYAGAGIVALLALAGYTVPGPTPWPLDTFIPSPKKVCSLPSDFWITTWDSTESDPKQVVQHKQVHVIRCDEDKIYGEYTYQAPSSGTGKIMGVKRMGGTWALTYWSEEKDGPGLGAVIVRPLAPLDSKAGTIFLGHEDGHDCTCGDHYASAGPFTSVPAAVSASHDLPAEIDAAARKIQTQDEIKFFPDDVFPKDARNKPAPVPVKAKG